MTVTVGRLRPCPVLDYKFVALGHNTIRGAAGAAILNAELMHREGCCDPAVNVRSSIPHLLRESRDVVMKFGGTSVADPDAISR